ncbi:MAG: efflux RND transporter permease subunit, partial [Acidobacteria bacterium]|nr:efflux RND transporter permease subunit [Acidobacteriota bacterium]
TFEGVMAEQRDAVGGLQRGFVLALLMIFALLAVPLKSYVQPLVIMSAIPFGLIGAVWGHVLLDLNLSMMSMFGLVAVTGVVVNDSLIMVDFINRARAVHAGVGRMARQAGGGAADRRRFESAGLALAVREAGVHRFRPILLTSLTTFFGLAPMMSDRSFDTAFMVPMAVSLGFGVLFATLITLILVPTSYMILDDIGRTMRRMLGGRKPSVAEPEGASAGALPAGAVPEGSVARVAEATS